MKAENEFGEQVEVEKTPKIISICSQSQNKSLSEKLQDHNLSDKYNTSRAYYQKINFQTV